MHKSYHTSDNMTFKTYDMLTVFELDFANSNKMELLDQDDDEMKHAFLIRELKIKEEQIDVIKGEVREVVSENPYF